jgi:hypothetical protein
VLSKNSLYSFIRSITAPFALFRMSIAFLTISTVLRPHFNFGFQISNKEIPNIASGRVALDIKNVVVTTLSIPQSYYDWIAFLLTYPVVR